MAQRVAQLLVGASTGDAITEMALNIGRKLPKSQNMGIYAAFPDCSVAHDVQSFWELCSNEQPDVLIYHASYGLKDLTEYLLNFGGRLIVCFHNITPSVFFEDIDPEFARGLDWGLEELRMIRSKAESVFADSTFNVRCLKELGYGKVTVLPVGLNAKRLSEYPPDIRLQAHYARMMQNGYVVTVSQLLPHKGLQDVIAAVDLCRDFYGLQIGLVCIGTGRSAAYAENLQTYASRLLGDVCVLTGKTNDRQLSTLLRHSLAYVGASHHEGFAVPLVEAMALQVPTVVRNVGAVEETAGGASFLLPPNAGPVEFSKAISTVVQSQDLRLKLVSRGLKRVEDFDKERILREFFRTTGLASQ